MRERVLHSQAAETPIRVAAQERSALGFLFAKGEKARDDRESA